MYTPNCTVSTGILYSTISSTSISHRKIAINLTPSVKTCEQKTC